MNNKNHEKKNKKKITGSAWRPQKKYRRRSSRDGIGPGRKKNKEEKSKQNRLCRSFSRILRVRPAGYARVSGLHGSATRRRARTPPSQTSGCRCRAFDPVGVRCPSREREPRTTIAFASISIYAGRHRVAIESGLSRAASFGRTLRFDAWSTPSERRKRTCCELLNCYGHRRLREYIEGSSGRRRKETNAFRSG